MEQVGHPAVAAGPPGRRLRAQRADRRGPRRYQDRLAKHAAFDDVFCRVRQYIVAQAAVEEQRQRMKRAAAREFQILQSFDHPGILDVLDYKDHEFGPALLFAPRARRRPARPLPGDARAEAHRRARGWSCSARSPTPSATPTASGSSTGRSAPQSILVMDPDADVPRLKVFNWQVGVREAEAASSGHGPRRGSGRVARPLVYMAPEALLRPARWRPRRPTSSRWGPSPSTCSPAGRPASSPTELARILREHKGLSISAVLDGAGPKLEELIRWSTHPDV